MKNVFLWGLWAALFGVVLPSCTSKTTISAYQFYVYVDITAKDIDFDAEKTQAFIQKTIGLNAEQLNAASITVNYCVFNEYHNNPIQSIKLDQGNLLLDPPQDRIAQQQAFLTQLQQTFKAEKNKVELPSSCIIEPFADLLNNLKTDSKTETIILLFSDMLHNYKEHSFYTHSDETLEQYLQANLQQQRFINTTIHCIYAPTSVAKDQLFQRTKKVYSNVLAPIGLQLQFRSNL